MKKQILFLAPLLLSFNLAAAHSEVKTGHEFHAVAMTDDIRNLLTLHSNNNRPGIIGSAIAGAERGAARPGERAATVHNAVFEDTKKADNIVELTVGTAASLITGFGGLIYGLVAAIPSAALGGLVGVKDGVVNNIRGQVEESMFEETVALHLFKWVNAVKAGRAELRGKIQNWQTVNNSTSIKDALASMIQQGQLATQLSEAKVDNTAMVKALNAIPKNKDNWKDFFVTLSAGMKLPNVTSAQYSNLVSTLTDWKRTSSFPNVTNQDIQENIYFALYFFAIVTNDDCSIINQFISDTAKN
jgi:hypothetical protein